MIYKSATFMLRVAELATAWIEEAAVSKYNTVLTSVSGNYVQKQAIAINLYVIMALMYTGRSRWPRGLSRSLSGTAGSIPAGSMNFCLLWVLSVLKE